MFGPGGIKPIGNGVFDPLGIQPVKRLHLDAVHEDAEVQMIAARKGRLYR